MNFKEFLKSNIVYLDGSMGTLLQQSGLPAGEHPENWNITHPDVIENIHLSYFNAGSNVVCTNTFGANSLKFSDTELENIIASAVQNAKNARNKSTNNAPKFIALDIGPTGKLLKPFGDLDFEDAVSAFAKTVKLGVKYGVDLILIETMNDSYETKAALLAAKENCDLPIVVTNAYGDDQKLMTGATPEVMVSLLEGMGVDALGMNCSLGPKELNKVAERILSVASIPVIFKPNAGLPVSVNGKTVFNVNADEFADEVENAVKIGVRAVGGCCGTTPEYIREVFEKTKNYSPKPITPKDISVISSYSKTVTFGKEPILIGERINPTGKKRFKQALMDNDIDYILKEGINQQEKGAQVLDVNVGIPDIDEANVLKNVVCELQNVTNLPLQIDTSNITAMENALRRYNGKALINSVNGKEESMKAVFPLVKKYGGVVVALTLDENGIPDTVQGRVDIAKKILKTASEYGIDKKNIIFDTLAMTVSADKNAPSVTLGALNIIKHQLGCNTMLGVSNVSFGLPNRDAVNSTFFALALENGLSAAIMNPYSADMMKTYYTFNALKGFDENCQSYIATADTFGVTQAVSQVVKTEKKGDGTLKYAIIKGLCENAAQITKEMLKSEKPLDIVNGEIIPALDKVGKGFEEKSVYLPQLLMSAEAAKSAFEVIKTFMQTGAQIEEKATFVLATVKGDIHDIGKNIVKLLLQNYGYKVVDLGKDVAPQAVLDAVILNKAEFVGLSALMTTTVPAMEETIKLIKQNAPFCKTIVGGAVLTKDYAEKIGADKYAKDAMEAVRFAENG